MIWWFRSYNITCVIEEKLEGGTPRLRIRKAKYKTFKKKDGGNPVERIIFMGGKNHEIMPPTFIEELSIKQNEAFKQSKSYKSLYGISIKGKFFLRLLKSGDNYSIVPWNNHDVENYLKVSEPVRKMWANNLFREGMDLFPRVTGFWEKYGSILIMGGTLVVVLFIFIFLFQKLDMLKDNTAAINNYADALREFTKAIAGNPAQKVT